MLPVRDVLKGDRLATARLLTQVENDTPSGRAAVDELFVHTGNALLVGVTGAPGTGKSTLVNRLAYSLRHPAQDQRPVKVGIIAVDPSSPFTGGALLGDRLRMRDVAGDPGVFIRSMASRGALGGLARTTATMTQVLDAAGYEIIIIETVGAGQSEVDIASLAHTTLVVECPGMGDDIQAIKAGILEIADIVVLNKADQPGADSTERALKASLGFGQPAGNLHHGKVEGPSAVQAISPDAWQVPVLRSNSLDGTGIEPIKDAIQAHADYLKSTGERQQRDEARMRAEVDALLEDMLLERWRAQGGTDRYKAIMPRLYARNISPRQAVEQLLSGN